MAQIILGKKTDIEHFPFADETHDMADFFEQHPQLLGPDTVIICRELQVGTADKSRRIDFLTFDNELNQVGIVELKNQFADEKILLQVLRYANWLRNNPDTIRYQVQKRNLKINAEEIDTEGLKIFIVAPKISRALAELCQYITTFEFEFVQIQRFKDKDGEIYAVTDIVEVETPAPTPSRARGEYDLAWYESQGVRSEQMTELKEGITRLESICNEQGWDLGVRYVKWSVRFQNPNGRNAFFIHVRKTSKHHLRMCLGREFVPDSLTLEPHVRKNLRHGKKSSRVWSLSFNLDHLNDYMPLLKAAYESYLD
jgi:hypothetical protein